jgi:hypothetical protein
MMMHHRRQSQGVGAGARGGLHAQQIAGASGRQQSDPGVLLCCKSDQRRCSPAAKKPAENRPHSRGDRHSSPRIFAQARFCLRFLLFGGLDPTLFGEQLFAVFDLFFQTLAQGSNPLAGLTGRGLDQLFNIFHHELEIRGYFSGRYLVHRNLSLFFALTQALMTIAHDQFQFNLEPAAI